MSHITKEQFLEDFADEAKVVYTLVASVNGTPVTDKYGTRIKVTGYDFDEVAANVSQLEAEVDQEIANQADEALYDDSYDVDLEIKYGDV